MNLDIAGKRSAKFFVTGVFWMHFAEAVTLPPSVVASPNEQHTTKLAYTKSEAALTLSLSVRTIENLIANKELAVRRVGKRVLVPHQSLLNFLKRDHTTSQ